MKTSSKIAIAAAAVGTWLLAKKKAKGTSGIGSTGVKYLVRYTPKNAWEEYPLCWLHYENGSANLQKSQDHATRFDSYEEAEKIAERLFNDDYYAYRYSYRGFEIIEKLDHDEKRVREAIEWVLGQGDSYRYRLLDRMRSDCDYYLGNGDRHGQYLWMTMDPQGHIDVMRALWDSFDEKPEWLTREKINWYADQMGVK